MAVRHPGSMGDLTERRAGVWARALQAAMEALWQAHGQPTNGYDRIRSDAELAARAAFEVAVAEADLFASGGERLAAALRAAEDCRGELLEWRVRRGDRPR
jgi:hypothetical protein